MINELAIGWQALVSGVASEYPQGVS